MGSWNPWILDQSHTTHVLSKCDGDYMEEAQGTELSSCLIKALDAHPLSLTLVIVMDTRQPAYDACLSRLEAGWGLRPWPWCLSRRQILIVALWISLLDLGMEAAMNIPFPWTRPDFVSCDADPAFPRVGVSQEVFPTCSKVTTLSACDKQNIEEETTQRVQESREKRPGLSSHLILSTSLLELPLSLHVPG